MEAVGDLRCALHWRGDRGAFDDRGLRFSCWRAFGGDLVVGGWMRNKIATSILAVALGSTETAYAGECRILSRPLAEQVLMVVREGMFVERYCHLCGDQEPSPVVRIESVRVLPEGAAGYQVWLNEQPVDLEFLFAGESQQDEVFFSVAHASGCPDARAGALASIGAWPAGASSSVPRDDQSSAPPPQDQSRAPAKPNEATTVVDSLAEILGAVSDTIDSNAYKRLPPIEVLVLVTNWRELAVAASGEWGEWKVFGGDVRAAFGWDSVESLAYDGIVEQVQAKFDAEDVKSTVTQATQNVTATRGKNCSAGRKPVLVQPGTYRLLRIKVKDPMALARREKGDFMAGLGSTVGVDIAGVVREEVEKQLCRGLKEKSVEAILIP